jgi:hypothetical protein
MNEDQDSGVVPPIVAVLVAVVVVAATIYFDRPSPDKPVDPPVVTPEDPPAEETELDKERKRLADMLEKARKLKEIIDRLETKEQSATEFSLPDGTKVIVDECNNE